MDAQRSDAHGCSVRRHEHTIHPVAVFCLSRLRKSPKAAQSQRAALGDIFIKMPGNRSGVSFWSLTIIALFPIIFSERYKRNRGRGHLGVEQRGEALDVGTICQLSGAVRRISQHRQFLTDMMVSAESKKNHFGG